MPYHLDVSVTMPFGGVFSFCMATTATEATAQSLKFAVQSQSITFGEEQGVLYQPWNAGVRAGVPRRRGHDDAPLVPNLTDQGVENLATRFAMVLCAIYDGRVEVESVLRSPNVGGAGRITVAPHDVEPWKPADIDQLIIAIEQNSRRN
jgi:hypothetical protein